MKPSSECLDLIKTVEGCELEAYLDTGGVWTIGVGHTKGVDKGQVITMKQAMEFLEEDLEDAVAAVKRHVDVPLRQREFDVLVSFVFNLGAGAFARSTLLKKLNAGDKIGAGHQLPRWNKDNGVVVKGLTNRRATELAMWEGRDWRAVWKELTSKKK